MSFYGLPRRVNLLCLVLFSPILLTLISLPSVLVPIFLATLSSISFSARIHVVRLYFISFAFYPKGDAIGWGYTVPIFPIVVFFGLMCAAVAGS